MRSTSLRSLFVALLCTTVWADDKPTPVKLEATYKGSVADLNLLKDVPMVITDHKEFAKINEAWKIEVKADAIDFKKHMVVIVTSRGSTLNLIATQQDGDVRVNGFGTKDLREGFRYVIGVISRDGVKTVNGKPLPETKKE